MSRRLTRFELCAGWDGVCPWKQARGLPLDTEGACPLCNAERLQHELGVRHGQDLTSALRRIKEVSEETYALAQAFIAETKRHVSSTREQGGTLS